MPSDTRNICQWDIWYVDWPHEDGTSSRRRALVVSSTSHNANSDEIWFIKISRQCHDVPFRIQMDKSDPAFPGTGLTDSSYFYLGDARSVTRDHIFGDRAEGRLKAFSALMMAMMVKRATHPPPP